MSRLQTSPPPDWDSPRQESYPLHGMEPQQDQMSGSNSPHPDRPHPDRPHTAHTHTGDSGIEDEGPARTVSEEGANREQEAVLNSREASFTRQPSDSSEVRSIEASIVREPSDSSEIKNIIEASIVREPSDSSEIKNIEASTVRETSEQSLHPEPTELSLPSYTGEGHDNLPPEYSTVSPDLVVAAPGVVFDEKQREEELRKLAAEERKRAVYTPALPAARRLEETRYSITHTPLPGDSDTEPFPPSWAQSSDKEPLTEPVGVGGVYRPPPFRPNQVSPAPQDVVDISELRQRSIGAPHGQHQSHLERKKSITFGADGNTDGAGCCGWILYLFSILLIVVTLPFSLVLCIKVVQEYERAVIFRLGRLPLGGAKGPGIFFIIPCIESYTKVDLRTVSFDVPPQEVLTKDSVTVSVDAVVYYRVSNPTVSVANVENAHHSTRLLAQTTLRNNLGTRNMTEILSDREAISQEMQATLDEATSRWGIKVERVEIKDVRLPVQLQRAMAAEAEATREARAKVIAAEGEQKASRALKNAADIMTQSGAALQLRYLQTLNSISAEKNSTIIFPLPIDMLSAFMTKSKS